MTTKRPGLMLGLVMLISLAAACGGETAPTASTEGTSMAPSTAGTVDPATPATAADAPAGTDAAAGGGTGLGFVEVGDLRHDLTITECHNRYGVLAGTAVSLSDPDNVQVQFAVSPENWQEAGLDEAGTINFIAPPAQWVTGQSKFAGYTMPDGVDVASLGITSFEVSDDGQSVMGEATFFEFGQLLGGTPVEPVQGSFEFSCPPPA